MKAVDTWLVVRTKFNHELKAERDLREIGMEVTVQSIQRLKNGVIGTKRLAPHFLKDFFL